MAVVETKAIEALRTGRLGNNPESPTHEDIAKVAHQLWLARIQAGVEQFGNEKEDWHQAEMFCWLEWSIAYIIRHGGGRHWIGEDTSN